MTALSRDTFLDNLGGEPTQLVGMNKRTGAKFARSDTASGS